MEEENQFWQKSIPPPPPCSEERVFTTQSLSSPNLSKAEEKWMGEERKSGTMIREEAGKHFVSDRTGQHGTKNDHHYPRCLSYSTEAPTFHWCTEKRHSHGVDISFRSPYFDTFLIPDLFQILNQRSDQAVAGPPVWDAEIDYAFN